MPRARKLLLSLETDPVKMCELLVGLPDVTVLGVKRHGDLRVNLHVQTNADVVGCSSCGVVASLKDWRVVAFAGLPAFASPGGPCTGTSDGGVAPRRRVRRGPGPRWMSESRDHD